MARSAVGLHVSAYAHPLLGDCCLRKQLNPCSHSAHRMSAVMHISDKLVFLPTLEQAVTEHVVHIDSGSGRVIKTLLVLQCAALALGHRVTWDPCSRLPSSSRSGCLHSHWLKSFLRSFGTLAFGPKISSGQLDNRLRFSSPRTGPFKHTC